MNDELRTLWKEANETIPDQGTWDVNHHRKRTSDRISKGLRVGITIDIIIKFVIAIAAFFLFITSGFDPSYVLLTIISLILLILMVAIGIVSKKKLDAISPDLPIVKRLERKLTFMKSTYRLNMISGALTAPLFVFTGNCYYFHYKYGELMFNDPVILVFITLAFIIAYAAQYPIYHLQVKELEEAVGDLDENKAITIDAAKSKQKGIYSSLMMIGIVILIVMLILFFIL
ncbi:MAG: hypothetical protein K9N05_03665 [Candidatus Marinimicrobia bacterium]|nr:hypothetical protein [Candidatus Neomarinimicrobiota bacterium]